MGALEGVSIDATRELFELNTFGPMAMMQAVLPSFRARGAGVIVNVSSAVTLKPLPLLSAYTASKAALEAFSEDLACRFEPELPTRFRHEVLLRDSERTVRSCADVCG